jgi:hypothetical protein
MKSGNKEKFEFTGQFGFNGVEVGIEGPFSEKSKASYLASYRCSTLEIFDLVVPAIPSNKKYGRFQIFGIGC